MTREELTTVLCRYLQYTGTYTESDYNLSQFSDADEVSVFAVDAIKYALESGLIKGKTENTINPKETTTRAEVATILYRFLLKN